MFLSLAALLCACDCGKATPPCETDQAPTACGAACSAANPCGAGTYCGTDGTCTADCTSAGGQCSADETCDTSGRCQPDGDSGSDATTDATDAMFSDVPGFDNVCADISATPSRVVPTVVLLVDRSSSMDDDPFFDDGDVVVERWDAVQTALIGNGSTEGLIEPLEGIVRFGLTTYSAFDTDNNGTPEGACPRVEALPANGVSPISAALNNYTAISGAYPGIGALQDETPTGESVAAVVAALVADPNVGRAIIVLATDGEPDSCEDPNPGNNSAARQLVYDAVESAYDDHDIETYVIAVAGEGSVSSDHLRQVANLGQGFAQADATERFFRPANVPDLVTALQGIVGGNIPCEVTLNGTVTPTAACSGTVTLNGAPLACTGPNGWTFIDDANDNTIRLNGTACITWRTDPNADLEASFPCDAIIIE